MRALIGLLVLGGLFVMAASWQNRMTAEMRDHRANRYGIPNDTVDGSGGWSRLVLGRPSGADPLPLPDDPGPQEPGGPTAQGGSEPWTEEGGRTAPEPEPQPALPKAFAYIVRPNDNLGEICQRHYDVRPLHRVVDAVAKYNDLPSPDAIRAGATLDLPHETVLFPELRD